MIPAATTTITVLRASSEATNGEPTYSGDSPVTRAVVATGIRAVIGEETGSEATSSGQQESTQYRLTCDPFDGALTHLDGVLDETTGEKYEVAWSMKRVGFGLDHWSAKLTQVSGLE